LAKVVDNDGRLFSTEFVGVYMQSWGGAAPVRPSIPRIRTAQKGTTKQIDVGGEPKVRIHFPPAVSQVSREVDVLGVVFACAPGRQQAHEVIVV
jgi:hypothetical protein